MSLTNFERMMKLADEAFDYRNDPDQLDVNEAVVERLKQMHPATLSEYNDNGPVVWVLLIPTTMQLMIRFVGGNITERELFDLTPVGISYEAIYLCSAMVLEEYRGQGIAKRMTLEAIERIRKDHPIQSLFVWPFSKGGDGLADSVAAATCMPLLRKPDPE